MSKYCSQCGIELADNAFFCSNCGNQVAETHNTSSHNHSSFACPNCHSENIQSLPIIYQSGSSGSNSITTADKFIAVTAGKNMTDLARSVAPPSKKEESWVPTILFGIFTFWGFDEGYTIMWLVCGVVTAILFFSVIEANNYNEKQFPIDYDNWQNSYLCHRCGNIFRIR